MSKIYKGWEILKMTEEGKFKVGDRIKNSLDTFTYRNNTWYDTDNVEANVSEFIQQDFEFLQLPITFVEAVKLFEQGSKIKCELGEINRIYDPTINYRDTIIGYAMQSVCNHPISTKEILEGKWYIKE